MKPAVAHPELPTFTSTNLIFNLNLRLAFWGLSQDQEKQTQQPEPFYSVVFQNEEGILGQGVRGQLSPCLALTWIQRNPLGLWEQNSPYSQSTSVEPQNLKHILMPHFLSVAPG